MRKFLIILGHLSILVTGMLAVIFYRERVLFVDSCQQIFEMINNGKFVFFQSRYSMILYEVFPYLAIKWGFTLKNVVLVFTLSTIFIYYLNYLICVYLFKNVTAGLCIALSSLLVRIAFGQTICEVWMGIGFSALVFSLLYGYEKWTSGNKIRLVIFYSLLIFFILLNYFIHPATLFMMTFIVGFIYFQKRLFKSVHIYISLALVLSTYLMKVIFPATSYEKGFMDGVLMGPQLIGKFFSLPLIQFAQHYFLKTYIYFLIIWIVPMIYYIIKKKFWLAGFVFAFPILYIIFAALACYQGDSHFMLETRLLPLVLMGLIPLLEVLQMSKKPLVVFTAPLLTLITLSYLSLITVVISYHTKRIQTYAHFLNEARSYPEKKFYVRLPADQYTPLNSWGSASETLMLSSLHGKNNSRTVIFIAENENIEEGMGFYPCIFLWLPWRMFVNEDDLNKKYFDLGCTPYRELKYSEVP